MNYDQLVERIRGRSTILASGCWIWVGCCANKKDAQTPVMRIGGRVGRVAPVRRFLLEFRDGDLNKINATNTCGVNLYVNPEHLSTMNPGYRKRRGVMENGEKYDGPVIVHREVGQWKADIPAVRTVFDLGTTV